MDPINPVAENPETLKAEGPERAERVERDNHWIAIVSMALFVLMSLGVVVFLFYQNQQLKSTLASCQAVSAPTPAATVSSTPNPNMPIVSTPSANMKIVSPLKVTGTVPTGWMSEGVFPIKLVDANQKLIIQGQAKEVVAGSWQSGNPVEFTATLIFEPASGSGKLILQNDNPSGLPSNSKTFEVPVIFSGSTACTLEAKVCPDGSSVGRTGPNCEFAPCP